jgi:hypothetical protein
MEKLREALDRYNGIVNNQIAELPEKPRKKVLDAEAKIGKDLGKDARRVDHLNKDNVNDILDRAPSTIDDYLHAMRKTDKDDAIKGAGITENLSALMGALNQDDLDMGDLLGTAGQLSSMLRGMINANSGLARELGTSQQNVNDAAKAAIELDRLIARLEGRESDFPEIVELPPPGPPVSTVSDDVFDKNMSLDKAKTVEDIMSAVAYEIHKLAQSVSAEGDKIAEALARLARCARNGDKQGMLIAAKEVAAHINAFCKELNEFAKRIPGKNLAEKREADRLIRAATGLRTFGTQLKILCSVKAASIETNKDNDESLASLTRNLGQVLTSGLTGLATVQRTILPRK